MSVSWDLNPVFLKIGEEVWQGVHAISFRSSVTLQDTANLIPSFICYVCSSERVEFQMSSLYTQVGSIHCGAFRAGSNSNSYLSAFYNQYFATCNVASAIE